MYPSKEDVYEYEAAATSPHALLNNPEIILEISAEKEASQSTDRSRWKWIPNFSSLKTPWTRQPSYVAVDGEAKECGIAEVDEELRDDMSGDTLLEGTPKSKQKRYSDVVRQAYRYAIMLLPSFLHPLFIQSEPSKGIRRSTDYLDGIRGVASLFVLIDHYLDGLHDGFEEWGYGQGHNRSFFQLPFVKLIYAGSCMVAIFFIVSGYVLSHRCIVSMRSNKHDKLYTALTSMIFRRGMRLFLPSVTISFVAYLTVCMGLVKSEIPRKKWTVWKETKHYVRYLNQDLFKLWTWQISYKGFYSPQLWTIPLEFKCSMVLFLVIMMLSRCRVSIRLAIESVFITYLFYDKRWDVALFIVGMLIAELNIIYDERKKREQQAAENLDEKPLAKPLKSKWYPKLAKTGLWAMLVMGLFIGGYPHGDAAHTPGYSWLARMWRGQDWEYKWRFWLSIAAIFIVFPVSFLPTAQSFFTTRIARYLGKISYGLYLVHALLDRTLRHFLWHLFWNVLHFDGKNGEELQYDGGWIIGTIIYMPLAFWAADIFTRMVDAPTVRFAKWIEGKCFEKTD